MNIPSWLKPIGVTVAVLLAGLLLAGQLGVIYRAVQSPTGYDQSRTHWNTKNTTRFAGADASEVSTLVSRAVYPATEQDNTPTAAILYDPEDWQGGLAASSLLRPLDAVLLPTGEGVEQELSRLGSPTVMLVNDAQAPSGVSDTQQIAAADIPGLLEQAGAAPEHVILVDQEEPGTALLAAPWAAYSSDLIVFDAADAPDGLPLYALGDVDAVGATRITGKTPAALSVAFAKYQDPENPFFGWGYTGGSPTGYRAFTLAVPNDPAMALQSANLARRGKIGPLLWTNERTLPSGVNNYLWSQRPAFYEVPNEGPFHHVWVLGDTATLSFPAQGQADYALEIGPYMQKGIGASGMDMLASIWIASGLVSALLIVFHQMKFLPQLSWVMRLAWPMLAMMIGPFGLPAYALAYSRPVMRHGKMAMWDRPIWLQAMVATASSVGFGGTLMVATGWTITLFGAPLVPNDLGGLFWLGAPMVIIMMCTYVVAVAVAWPLYQTPMIAMLHGKPYGKALLPALPIVLISMAAVSLAMFPGMWWLMMWELPMMPSEESILWFGVMYATVFLGFLTAWPINYLLVRRYRKSGMM